MGDKGFKRFLPSFFLIVYELFNHWKRDVSQNSNIKKIDKTAEKLGTIEHMLVRLEKKIQANRDIIQKLQAQLLISKLINLVLLIIILLRLFGVL